MTGEFCQYPKVVSIGQKGMEELFADDVVITEKIDGNNVRIMNDGKALIFGSHRTILAKGNPDAKMFVPFLDWVENNYDNLMRLIPKDCILFGEMAQNQCTLKYDKTYPLVLFDIAKTTDYGLDFVDSEFQQKHLSEISGALNIPKVPIFYIGRIEKAEQLAEFLERDSFLGRTKLEGIVIKNYSRLNQWNRQLFAKLVREEFREENKRVFKRVDFKSIEEEIAERFFTRARLVKMVQKLKEEGKYEGHLRDIRHLVGDTPKDIYEENKEDIKEILFEHFWKRISRIVTGRVAPEYKKLLEEELFETMAKKKEENL